MRIFYSILLLCLLAGCAGELRKAVPPEPPQQFEMAKIASTSQAPPVLVRRLVRKFALDIRVQETTTASSDVNKLAAELGGHVETMNANRYESGVIYQMTLRIPETRADEAVGRIKMLGQVDRENISTEDVTDKFVDLSARLKTLEATETELRGLLSESRQRQQKAEDIMAIYRQLTEIRSNIEQLRGQLNVIENLAAMATINLSLSPVASPVTVVSAWQPSETVRNSFRSLVALLTGMVDLLIMIVIVVIPPVLILAVFAWLAIRVWRAARARRPSIDTPV